MRLPQRQRDVLRLAAEGKRSREIAEALGVKQSTVETHIKAACKRFDARGRVEVIRRCRDLGILP